jgi:hypothetical protein
MSVSGISSASLSAIQNNYQQLRTQFNQLGQDLSAGNLSQAQSDFVTLSQAAATQFGSNSPITQALSSVGQALQSGSVSAAQQAFSALSGGAVGPNAVSHHSHGHHRLGGSSQLEQELQQLGQALQSGNLSGAQQAFATLQQNFPQLASASATTATNGSTITNTTDPALSVTA